MREKMVIPQKEATKDANILDECFWPTMLFLVKTVLLLIWWWPPQAPPPPQPLHTEPQPRVLDVADPPSYTCPQVGSKP